MLARLTAGLTALVLAGVGIRAAHHAWHVRQLIAANDTRSTILGPNPSGPATVIGVIGDSISRVGGAETAPVLAAQEIARQNGLSRITLVNEAFPGTSTADWTSTSARGLLPHALGQFRRSHVQCVFVMLGANDANDEHRFPAARYEANLRAITQTLAWAGYPVVLNTPIYPRPSVPTGKWNQNSVGLVRDYDAACRRVADGRTVLLGDTGGFAAFKAHTGWSDDGVHPNAQGRIALGHLWAASGRAGLSATHTVVVARRALQTADGG